MKVKGIIVDITYKHPRRLNGCQGIEYTTLGANINTCCRLF